MPYLVMEFLDGQTLSDFQKANPRIALPLIADLLDQIGLALGEAHRHGIVHRDLKPDNIWLEPNGRGGYTVKVLDFGVAKVNLLGEWAPRVQEVPAASAAETGAPGPAAAGDETETMAIDTPAARGQRPWLWRELRPALSGSFDSGADAQTMPGSLIGTPAYMSPEQALGQEIDFRSDIYSLAVVAYSLVCGELPFTGRHSGLFEFHRTGSPPPPASIRKVPRDVSDAILAGLARDPADRPASAVGIHAAVP